MRPHRSLVSFLALAVLLFSVPTTRADPTYSWRYYRPGNTGIQGDYHDAIWIAPDGNPYIGGYDPIFEEGGFVKYLRSENRWINYSNVDYPIIGHPNAQGRIRVRDIVPEASGKLWLATWDGALSFDPSIGPASLVRHTAGNSGLNADFVWDIDKAPDGTMWFANNGSARYNPVTHAWTRWDNMGNTFLAVQPKSGGGYFVWSASRPPTRDYAFVFDSATQQWTVTNVTTPAPNQFVGMPGHDCVDETGNFWALRSTVPGGYDSLDYRRSNGTWVTPPEPYNGVTFDIWAFKAYGIGCALLVDGNNETFAFNGTSWTSFGIWRPGAYTSAVDIDAVGNVWVCGVGGAARRDAQSGVWQRYRITNTGNFDAFNSDLTVDPVNGHVYAGANAAPGVGGMVRFDGTRWVCWDQATYGLGYPWPFPSDNCLSLAYRPSNGRVAVSPYWDDGIHQWNGSSFDMLQPNQGAKRMCEDSSGRLWAIGEYYSLRYYNGSTWNSVPITAWGKGVVTDPTRPGTVWAITGSEFVRTDGAYRFSRTLADFPELTDNTDQFLGLAADANGVAWVGATALYDGPTPGGVLIKIDADTGAYQMLRNSQGWPFPGDTVTPLAVTPDGRLWMQYDDSNYPYEDVGLCWYDGVNVGSFPAPPGGEPQWGGLPHRQIEDLEVRVVSGGYELWMSCLSRGIAVLTVTTTPTVVDRGATPTFALEQNYPNPFNPTTTISFELPREGHSQLQIYDVRGQLVATLIDRVLAPGEHSVQWDAHNMSSGVYFYELETPGFKETRKMVLLK